MNESVAHKSGVVKVTGRTTAKERYTVAQHSELHSTRHTATHWVAQSKTHSSTLSCTEQTASSVLTRQPNAWVDLGGVLQDEEEADDEGQEEADGSHVWDEDGQLDLEKRPEAQCPFVQMSTITQQWSIVMLRHTEALEKRWGRGEEKG